MADAKSWYARRMGNPPPQQQPVPQTPWPNQLVQPPQPNQPQQQGPAFATFNGQGSGDTNYDQSTSGVMQAAAKFQGTRAAAAGVTTCPNCDRDAMFRPGINQAPQCYACGYNDRLGSQLSAS